MQYNLNYNEQTLILISRIHWKIKKIYEANTDSTDHIARGRKNSLKIQNYISRNKNKNKKNKNDT